jgi:hypothetical protein
VVATFKISHTFIWKAASAFIIVVVFVIIIIIIIIIIVIVISTLLASWRLPIAIFMDLEEAEASACMWTRDTPDV